MMSASGHAMLHAVLHLVKVEGYIYVLSAIYLLSLVNMQRLPVFTVNICFWCFMLIVCEAYIVF